MKSNRNDIPTTTKLPSTSLFPVGARAVASVPILLTLLPISTAGRWWVRIWEFPRLQIAGCGLLALWSMIRYSRRTAADAGIILGLAGSVVYQLAKIFPYTPLSSKQVRESGATHPDRHISLLTANVFMRNRDSEAILKAIRTKNPDVVCLVETDQWWERQMRVLEKTHPHCLKCPLENTYGMVLYSRLPFEEARTRFLVQDDVPSMRAVVRMRSGDAVVLYCVHPRPPRPAQASYARDAELVLVGRELHADTRPSIVLGDLNDVGWSYTTTLFQRISHTLDPRAGRGMYNTYNAKIPVLRYPLDHCFHTGRFSLVRLERLGYIGSDHFPMFVELSIEERPQQTNPVPHTTPEDRANADEMIADAADRNKLDSGQSELFFRESE